MYQRDTLLSTVPADGRWLIESIQYQHEFPIWWGGKGDFIQCKELTFESQGTAVRAAWWWGGPGVRQPWVRPLSGYTTLLALCSGLLHRHLQCFSSSKETQTSGRWKGKPRPPSQRVAGFYRQKSLPWFLIGPSSCKWELQILAVWSLDQRLLSHCLDWSEWRHFDWSVKMLVGS